MRTSNPGVYDFMLKDPDKPLSLDIPEYIKADNAAYKEVF